MTEKPENPRARGILVLLLVICIAPFVIALLLYSNRSSLLGSRHHGILIEPAIPIERSSFVGFDSFSRENISELKGHWVLVHFVTPHGCGSVCRKSLEKTRQVRLMLNKDLMRVRRVAVVMGEFSEVQANEWWSEHPYLLRVVSNRNLEQLAALASGSPIPDGSVLIMDPLGNFMMWYSAEFDPYGLKKDLQRLLRVSRIG